MKRISGYQTTDGKLFHDADVIEATKHQTKLNLAKRLTEIGTAILTDGVLDTDDRGSHAIFDGLDFAYFVIEHIDEIKAAFKSKATLEVEVTD